MYWTETLIVAGGALALLAARNRAERRRETLRVRLRALRAIRYLCLLLDQLQQHRGLCFGYMSGESGLEGRLWAIRQQMETLLAESDIHAAALHWYPSWYGLLEGWEQVRQWEQREEASPESVLADHNALIAQLLETIRGLADAQDFVRQGGLVAQPGGVWLELLEHCELLGQARAVGTGIAARRQNTPAQHEALSMLRRRIADRAYFSLVALHSDPVLRLQMQQGIAEAEASLDELLDLIDRLLASVHKPAVHSMFYFQTATRTISAHLSLVHLLLDRLQQAELGALS